MITIHVSGYDACHKFATEHDLHVLGEIIDGSNHFHVRHRGTYREKPGNRTNMTKDMLQKGNKLSKRLYKRSLLQSHQIEKRILSHSDVSWAERQVVKARFKRDYGDFYGK